MADIHQWRRMIQTARSRTPATDTDDSEGVLFPRKGLKPKVSSYLTQQSAPSFPSRTNSTITNNAYHQHLPSWSTDQTIPDPDVGKLIDSVMSRLLAEPYCGLDSRFNGSLLQIFEAFRHVNDENIQLQSLLEQEINKCSSLERAIHESAKQWSREREEFQAEVRRLELIVAKGERGLAEVTLVRQDSLLRYGQRIRDNIKADKTLETVFEFLERTRRREDAKWNSQRATMRKAPTSPSASMRRLSKTFLHQPSPIDLPAGTLGDVSLLERTRQTIEPFQTIDMTVDFHQHHKSDGLDQSFGIPERRTSSSADTLSTFSCDGDLLPDETADLHLINAALAGTNLAKHPRLRRKATEFYSKWKPQLKIDTLRAGRRFSFEVGDDNEASLTAPPLERLPAAVKDRLLRKSVSMSVLSEKKLSKGSQPEPTLSPLQQSPQQSPTTSIPPSETRKPTRIPTPIHGHGSLARPRQEREDSSSSLLTAIRHADELCQRSGSASSSVLGSPCASRVDLMQENQGSQAHGTSIAATNPLLDRTNHLRGNAFAAAAAKATNAITMSADHEDLTDSASSKRPRFSGSNGKTTRGLTQSRMMVDMSELRKVNGEPMGLSADGVDQKDNATL